MCRPILDLYAQEDRLKYTSSGLLFPPSALILTWETLGVGRTKALAAQASRTNIAAVFMIKRWERSCVCVKVWNGSDPEEWRYREEGGPAAGGHVGARASCKRPKAGALAVVGGEPQKTTNAHACVWVREGKVLLVLYKRADVAFPREGEARSNPNGIRIDRSTKKKARRMTFWVLGGDLSNVVWRVFLSLTGWEEPSCMCCSREGRGGGGRAAWLCLLPTLLATLVFKTSLLPPLFSSSSPYHPSTAQPSIGQRTTPASPTC